MFPDPPSPPGVATIEVSIADPTGGPSSLTILSWEDGGHFITVENTTMPTTIVELPASGAWRIHADSWEQNRDDPYCWNTFSDQEDFVVGEGETLAISLELEPGPMACQ